MKSMINSIAGLIALSASVLGAAITSIPITIPGFRTTTIAIYTPTGCAINPLYNCFTSSAAVATSYCSSVLGIKDVTTYISTSTPLTYVFPSS